MTEGVVYKNVFGSNLNGPLLPKNPALTDHILKVALKKKNLLSEFPDLDDTLEEQALGVMLKRTMR
jgi:CobQ-like glutamine amidotransferase family enzyme